MRSAYEDATMSLGACGSVVVVVFRDVPTVDHLERLFATIRSTKLRHKKIGLLNVAVSGTPRFPSDVRKRAAEHLGRGLTDVQAHVVLVPGFAGTAIRSFVSTITLLGRTRTPSKVFSELGPASTWLVEVLEDRGGEPPAAEDLLDQATGLTSP
jgi:hypothetical protein